MRTYVPKAGEIERAWWVVDAKGMTLALHSAIDDTRRADRAAALLAIVGLVMVPVIFWSINCPDPNQCAALHQRSSMSEIDGIKSRESPLPNC